MRIDWHSGFSAHYSWLNYWLWSSRRPLGFIYRELSRSQCLLSGFVEADSQCLFVLPVTKGNSMSLEICDNKNIRLWYGQEPNQSCCPKYVHDNGFSPASSPRQVTTCSSPGAISIALSEIKTPSLSSEVSPFVGLFADTRSSSPC